MDDDKIQGEESIDIFGLFRVSSKNSFSKMMTILSLEMYLKENRDALLSLSTSARFEIGPHCWLRKVTTQYRINTNMVFVYMDA